MTVSLAFDDTDNVGPLIVLLPGAGDLRSEYRFQIAPLVRAGFRVVTADLPGHGESPLADEYTVETLATGLIELLESLGPAIVVGTSFAPSAAVWAAAERPDLVRAVVAISAHLLDDTSIKAKIFGGVTNVLLRGPWAAPTWAKLYAGWYKGAKPADLDHEIDSLRAMFADPKRRRAARETLTADRAGVAERLAKLNVPTLTVFGSADDHFPDAAAEGRDIAAKLNGALVVVDGAGHYPHVEQPDTVTAAIVEFANGVR